MTIEPIIVLVGAIVTVITGIIGIIEFIKKRTPFKEETLFGEEANERFERIKTLMPNTFDTLEFKGGNIKLPKFEVKKIIYDKQTMPTEWEKCKKVIRYYYEENGKRMEKRWLLK
jgi:hypothetical protein